MASFNSYVNVYQRVTDLLWIYTCNFQHLYIYTHVNIYIYINMDTYIYIYIYIYIQIPMFHLLR